MRHLFRPELLIVAFLIFVGLAALKEEGKVKPHDPNGCWACQRLKELNQPLPTNEVF